MDKETKRYRFYWFGGAPPEEGEGTSVADAFTRLGYSAGALSALEHYEVIPPQPPS